jgi:phage baseplate assembly protein W
MAIIYYTDISKRGKDILGTRDIPTLSNEQAVKESISNILLTELGTKLFDPEYGVNLERYLFEPIDDMTAMLMSSDIESAIYKFETRVDQLSVTITPMEDDNTYIIDIAFNVIFNSVRQNMNLMFDKIR